MSRRIAAILLAAGRSRRMGAFKPLLPFPQGRTVVEACIRNLLDAGLEEVIVVVGHRAEEVTASVSHLPVRLVLNADAESGMSASIARGVEMVSADAAAVLIALVDQPAVPHKVLRALIEALGRESSLVVVPEWDGHRAHPVLVDLQLREELLSLDAERGLRGLLDAHEAHVLRLPVERAEIARDMDTWDDYIALHRDVFGALPERARPEN